MIYQESLEFATSGHGDMRDITEEVALVLSRAAVSVGSVLVHVIGSTGAVGTIEYEPGLRRDLPEQMDRLFPPGRHYAHEQTWHDGNAHSHLQATTLGPSLSVPFSEGRLLLGTWQQIFFLECDTRPHERKVIITVSGS